MKTLSVGQLIEMLCVAAVMLPTHTKTRTVSKPTEITPHQRSHIAFRTTLSNPHKEGLFGQSDKVKPGTL